MPQLSICIDGPKKKNRSKRVRPMNDGRGPSSLEPIVKKKTSTESDDGSDMYETEEEVEVVTQETEGGPRADADGKVQSTNPFIPSLAQQKFVFGGSSPFQQGLLKLLVKPSSAEKSESNATTGAHFPQKRRKYRAGPSIQLVNFGECVGFCLKGALAPSWQRRRRRK